MLNRRIYLLLTIVHEISYCYEECYRRPLILVFILLSPLTVGEKEENKTEKKQTHSDIIILFIYLFE